jgi:hypothetical protein
MKDIIVLCFLLDIMIPHLLSANAEHYAMTEILITVIRFVVEL